MESRGVMEGSTLGAVCCGFESRSPLQAKPQVDGLFRLPAFLWLTLSMTLMHTLCMLRCAIQLQYRRKKTPASTRPAGVALRGGRGCSGAQQRGVTWRKEPWGAGGAATATEPRSYRGKDPGSLTVSGWEASDSPTRRVRWGFAPYAAGRSLARAASACRRPRSCRSPSARRPLRACPCPSRPCRCS